MIDTCLVCCSGVMLGCGIHDCTLICHPRSDHSSMHCEVVVDSFCPKKHPWSYTCHQGPPISCAKCDDAARLEEPKRQEQEEAFQRAFRAKRLAEINEQVTRDRESILRSVTTSPSSLHLSRLPTHVAEPPSSSTSGTIEASKRIATIPSSSASASSSLLQYRNMSQALPLPLAPEPEPDIESAARWIQDVTHTAKKNDEARRAQQEEMPARERQAAGMATQQAEHRARHAQVEAKIAERTSESQRQAQLEMRIPERISDSQGQDRHREWIEREARIRDWRETEAKVARRATEWEMERKEARQREEERKLREEAQTTVPKKGLLSTLFGGWFR